ncbi:hypothetical protein [Faecalispora jeddahensis]|uniref:hypothetical protein n=1 Tax=Faecalispora jeddahensis TaxID=1414721 RepID=UPI0027B99D32|nr:hypothetical protein [Faecalispora jeddahensis]
MMISNLAITFSEQNKRILTIRGDENDKSPERTSDKRKQARKPACFDQAARHRNAGSLPESAGEAIFALQTCGQSESFPFLCFCGQLRAKAAPHSLMWCRFVLIKTKSFSPESLIRFVTQNDYLEVTYAAEEWSQKKLYSRHKCITARPGMHLQF